MVISFEGNKLEYGSYGSDTLDSCIRFAPLGEVRTCGEIVFANSFKEGFYKENDTILNAYFDEDEDIMVYMQSGDIFLVLEPFDIDRCRLKKIKEE